MSSDIWKKASSKIIISAALYSAAVITTISSILTKLSNETVDVTVSPSIDVAAIIALIANFAFFRPNISKLKAEEHSDVNLKNLTNIQTGYTFVITASLMTYILLMMKQPVLSTIPICFVFYGFIKMFIGYNKNLRGYKLLRTSTILFAIAGSVLYLTLFVISSSLIPGFIDDSTIAGEIFMSVFARGWLICSAVFALILAIIASFTIIIGWIMVKNGGFLPPDEY